MKPRPLEIGLGLRRFRFGGASNHPFWASDPVRSRPIIPSGPVPSHHPVPLLSRLLSYPPLPPVPSPPIPSVSPRPLSRLIPSRPPSRPVPSDPVPSSRPHPVSVPSVPSRPTLPPLSLTQFGALERPLSRTFSFTRLWSLEERLRFHPLWVFRELGPPRESSVSPTLGFRRHRFHPPWRPSRGLGFTHFGPQETSVSRSLGSLERFRFRLTCGRPTPPTLGWAGLGWAGLGWAGLGFWWVAKQDLHCQGSLSEHVSEGVKKWFECVWVSERVIGLCGCDCECDV